MRGLHKSTFPINKTLIDQPFKTPNFNFNRLNYKSPGNRPSPVDVTAAALCQGTAQLRSDSLGAEEEHSLPLSLGKGPRVTDG